MEEAIEARDTPFVLFDLTSDASPNVVAVVAKIRPLLELRSHYSMVPETFWSSFEKSVVEKLGVFAAIPLPTLLAQAWAQYRPFLAYTNRDKYSSDQEIHVALGKHTLSASLRPTIKITVEGKVVETIHFETEISVAIQSAEVLVQNDRVRELRAGNGTVTGTLKCEGATIAEKAFKPLNLPAHIRFGSGVPIKPWANSTGG
jgi:hypothetical protein